MHLASMDTDKGSAGHNYLQAYDRLIRDTPSRVLEIGVQAGYSLWEWASRWPGADIHGIDITDAAIQVTGGWTVHIGDAYSADMLDAEWAAAGFDLIIDDGPHSIESQCYAAAEWSRHLRPGGWLFIEDVPSHQASCEIAAALPERLRRNAFTVDLTAVGNPLPDSRIVAAWMPEEPRG